MGANSPAIIGNDNKVTINDIPAQAVKYLTDQLNATNQTLAQKTAEANEWARKYRELDQQLTEARSQLTAKGDDATLPGAIWPPRTRPPTGRPWPKPFAPWGFSTRLTV